MNSGDVRRTNREELADELLDRISGLRERIVELEAREQIREKAEKELRESERQSRILFEFAPDAYYLSDLKGHFLDGNRNAEIMIGYKGEELIGKSYLDLDILPKSQVPKALALLAKNAMGLPTGPDEFTLIRKDGKELQVEIRTYPMRIKDKLVVLGIARDIAKHKKVEGELQAARDELARLEKERTAELAKVTKALEEEVTRREHLEELVQLRSVYQTSLAFQNVMTLILGHIHLALEVLPLDSPARNHLLQVEKAASELATKMLDEEASEGGEKSDSES